MKKYVIQLIEIQEETKKKQQRRRRCILKHFQKVVENDEEHDELLGEVRTTNYWEKKKRRIIEKKRKKNSIKVFIENVRISLVFAEITSDVMRIKKNHTILFGIGQIYWVRWQTKINVQPFYPILWYFFLYAFHIYL